MWYSNKHLRPLCLLWVLLLLCGCSAAETATPPATVTPTTAAMTTTAPTVATTATSADGTTVTTTAATAPDVSPNDDGVEIFLLIGSDARAEDTLSRSDTMMLIAVDSTARTVKLVSLLRDTWVTIPSLDNNGDGIDDVNKLNAAYFFGGMPMLSQTVLDNFGIPVDACVTVDFEAFQKAVDILGGIDVTLTEAEIEWINDLCDPDIVGQSGTYHLNGAQTLAFSRARMLYADGDFSRQANQRQVLRALMAKAKSSDAATMLDAITAMLPFIDTDADELKLIGLASQLLGASDYTLETHMSVPAPGEFENRRINGGLGLWLTDKEATAENLKDYIYG